jgi:two-component system, chemotaxis family, sensor kinase CheA
MAFDISKFKDLFVSENETKLEELSRDVLRLESHPLDSSVYEVLMRGAHTIKGSSATMGYTQMAEIAHAFEDVVVALEKHNVALSPQHVSALLSGVDALRASLAHIKHNEVLLDYSHVLSELKHASQSSEIVVPKTSGLVYLPPVLTPDTVKVSTDKLDDLMGLFEELLMLRLKLGAILEPVEEVVRSTSDSTTREKLSFVHEFRGLFAEMSHVLSEYQDALLSIRLVTLDQIFQQYPRMVRDLAEREGKHVVFSVHGEDIALDRTVIDGLGGALTHLLRNAVDHGISSEGKILLTAVREKDRVRVSVEDDGVGIDYARVRGVALERGVVTPEELATLSLSGVAELLFHPNMTTTEEVTDVSGRGVGVSAVYSFVREVGGRIDIVSPIPEIGHGARFTLDLPISLATIRVLIVDVSGYTFAIPFEHIVRTHRYTHADVSSVAHQRMLMADAELLPLMSLSDLLGLISKQKLLSSDAQLAVLVESQHRTVALEVSSVSGEQDLLIKSLPPLLRDMRGFSGSALLPDGRTILLLDIHSLLGTALGDILVHDD